MTRRNLSMLACAFAILSTAAVRAEKPQKLQLKFPKDKGLIYRKTTNAKKTEKVNKMTVKTDVESKTLNVHTLKNIDKKGHLQLETEIKKINISVNIGPLGKYTFDSTSSENEKDSTLGAMFTPILETLNGAVVKVSVLPDGRVLKVKGYEELLAETVKDNPLKSQYSNAAFQVEFSEAFVRLPGKPVKKGDTWTYEHNVKLPGIGTMKGTSKFTHAGTAKAGGRDTVKITATYEGSLEIDMKRDGAEITGTLTMSEATATIHFDPKAGCLVSKTKTARLAGTMNVEVNGMTIPVENDQTSTLKIELLEKLPN